MGKDIENLINMLNKNCMSNKAEHEIIFNTSK